MAKQQLNTKEKNIATIASYTAAGDMDRLTDALNRGLDDGLTVNEIKEELVQLYAYCGFPRSLNAITNFMNVVRDRESRGITDPVGVAPTPLAPDADRESIGRETREKLTGAPFNAAYATFTPVIDTFLKEHLFADIFARGVLTAQEREIATVAALATMTGTEGQLAGHIGIAKNIGVTDEQIAEILAIARTPRDILFGLGAPNDANARYFSGPSYLAPITTEQMGVFNVTFEPGVRNNWHIHHGGGQILLATAGRGYYQAWGESPRELRPGDVVNIPAGQKHWHGAAPDSWFTHIAIEVPGENNHAQWLEPVSDAEYSKLK
ncbi:MAG: carboxymuconolactone decarboxylase family protein [Alphaproteobacteria bacterium]|nr:carboxymuconolactone decarboxylase family protein [Alphaproteobacteria bacterium]